MSLSAFEQFAAQHRPAIESALDRFCPADDGVLREAMRYSLLLPGKRIRPLLVLMAAGACGGSVEKAMPGACAVEMVHAFSLIHDDLPAMDNDDLRRGKPTNHKVYGQAQAILAGDALLALAFQTLAENLESSTARACVLELARASGASGMTGGQSIDVKGFDSVPGIDAVRALHARKTGALIVASVRIGALIAGAPEKQLHALSDYARSLGIAFQVTDDLLDVTGSDASLGKTAGKDTAQGKATYPALLGLDGAKKEAEKAVEHAARALKPFEERAAHLRSLAEYVLSRDR